MKLTAHQEKKLEECLDILKTHYRLILKGSAGVGKTFLLEYLIRESPVRGPEVLCAAPTNKAVAVIKEKVSYPGVEFKTVHSALGLRRSIDNKTGKVSFRPYKSAKPPIMDFKYVLIDESSMLNKDLIEYIQEYCKDIKVIFIGDEKQLPPVGEEVSPIFTSGYPEVELTEIVRQAKNNPIIELSRNLSGINLPVDNIVNDVGYLYSTNRSKIIQNLAQANGTDQLKYLSYTNKDVNYTNIEVRELIYGKPDKIEIGESIILDSPYGPYYTNQEVVVLNTLVMNSNYKFPTNKEKTEFRTVTFKIYKVEVRCRITLVKHVLTIIHEDSDILYNEVVNYMATQARVYNINWVDFYEFTDKFCKFKYNHALTIHKSQGSTFENVIVNLNNVYLNRNKKELSKLLYTAVTRASKTLILYKYA